MDNCVATLRILWWPTCNTQAELNFLLFEELCGTLHGTANVRVHVNVNGSVQKL